MIKELHLKNWKSFGESTLYIDPLSILIGTNASGKSNVFDALQFLAKIATGHTISKSIDSARGGAAWMIYKKARETTLTAVIETKSNQEYIYEITLSFSEDDKPLIKEESLTQNDLEKKLFYTSPNQADLSSLYTHIYRKGSDDYVEILCLDAQHSVLHNVKGLNLNQELTQVVTEILSGLAKITFIDPIPLSMRGYAPLSNVLQSDTANIAGVLAKLKSDERDKVSEVMVKYLSQLVEQRITSVWAEPVGRLGSDAMLYCEESWGEETLLVDARGLSDGTLRFLGIMTALLTAKEGSLLLIEEVDNGLHPSRVKVLFDFLQKIGQERKVDVLCTTHNPAFLDALGNEMILFVSLVYRDKETGESKITLLEDLEDLPKIMARGTLGQVNTAGLLEKSVQ